MDDPEEKTELFSKKLVTLYGHVSLFAASIACVMNDFTQRALPELYAVVVNVNDEKRLKDCIMQMKLLLNEMSDNKEYITDVLKEFENGKSNGKE